jgi:hypothetical protein
MGLLAYVLFFKKSVDVSINEVPWKSLTMYYYTTNTSNYKPPQNFCNQTGRTVPFRRSSCLITNEWKCEIAGGGISTNLHCTDCMCIDCRNCCCDNNLVFLTAQYPYDDNRSGIPYVFAANNAYLITVSCSIFFTEEAKYDLNAYPFERTANGASLDIDLKSYCDITKLENKFEYQEVIYLSILAVLASIELIVHVAIQVKKRISSKETNPLINVT